MQLIERNGALAEAVDAVLRTGLNRGNRWFFRQAAEIPLVAWPAWRDAQIEDILDGLRWLSIWELADGEYTVRQGMGRTVAVKAGDRITFYDVSARGRRYDCDQVWSRGAPCPYALSARDIARVWDEYVQEARLYEMQLCAPDDCVRTWSEAARRAVSEIFILAAQQNWRQALAVANACDDSALWGLRRYLAKLLGEEA
jgi:hypothetical protein